MDSSCNDAFPIALQPYYVIAGQALVFSLSFVITRALSPYLECIVKFFASYCRCCKQESNPNSCWSHGWSVYGPKGSSQYTILFQLMLSIGTIIYNLVDICHQEASIWSKYQHFAIMSSQTSAAALFVKLICQSENEHDIEGQNTNFRTFCKMPVACVLGPVYFTHGFPMLLAYSWVIICIIFAGTILMFCIYVQCCHCLGLFQCLFKKIKRNDSESLLQAPDVSTRLEWPWGVPDPREYPDIILFLSDFGLFVSTQLLFGTAIPYGILLYGGTNYLDVIKIEFNARSSECYFKTLQESLRQKIVFLSSL